MRSWSEACGRLAARGESGAGEALDFAVTSAMRTDMFRRSVHQPSLAIEAYERQTREFQGIAQSCEAEGFHFVTFVFEAHSGGLSGAARGLCDWISGQIAAVQNEEPGQVSLKMAQRISIALHRENARAILRRMSGLPSARAPSVWEGSGVDMQFWPLRF